MGCCRCCWLWMSTGWSGPRAATTRPGWGAPWQRAGSGDPGWPAGPGSADRGSGPLLAPPRSALASWQAFAATELLDELAVERMLAKLSCRRYRVGLEPVGVEVEGAASGISKSAVSCWLLARTEYALAGCSPRTDPAWTWWRCWWLGSGWPSTAVWLPWASPSTGPRFPLALAEGATENATVVTEVLVGVARY